MAGLVAANVLLRSALQALRQFKPASYGQGAVARSIEEERKRAARDMAGQHARFCKALDNMNQGLLMFDQDDRLLLANAAFARVAGVGPESLQPGAPLADIVHAVANAGMLGGNPTEVLTQYTEMLKAGLPTKFVRSLPDGRQLAANFAPHDDGWVITWEDMTESVRAAQRVAHVAHHDALTGLPNRLMLRLSTEQALAERDARGDVAVLYLDLDHFKTVNDTLGHSTGDQLLCHVARRIESHVRPSDIVARLGGDEFAVVVAPAESTAAVALIATRLVEAIAAPYNIHGQQVTVSASAGIAMASTDTDTPDKLMRNADMALYRAKNDGRGRATFFEPAMEEQLVARLRRERDLQEAVTNNALELYYQPIISATNRAIIGFEALLRWRHPADGMISPAEFVPLAEENGLIIPIGEWALRRACLDAVSWDPHLKIAVNLSPVQFRSGNLLRAVSEALACSGLGASQLELEITESAMMQDTAATLSILVQLKALGVRIAMDDFGTGYSSLAYLQKFPFDKVKIDRTFVADSEQPTSIAIIRAIRAIAASMGIRTTAEGVETEAQFTRVTHENCDEVQGFLFSRPRPASDIPAMLAQQAPPPAIRPLRTPTIHAVS